jgi:hypothetical protein
LVSPTKHVQFNMKPMPPTPSRGSITPRSILKTPSKMTPLKLSDGGSLSPDQTPRKVVFGSQTPRRNISMDRKAATV